MKKQHRTRAVKVIPLKLFTLVLRSFFFDMLKIGNQCPLSALNSPLKLPPWLTQTVVLIRLVVTMMMMRRSMH